LIASAKSFIHYVSALNNETGANLACLPARLADRRSLFVPKAERVSHSLTQSNLLPIDLRLEQIKELIWPRFLQIVWKLCLARIDASLF
jgi:hypothetical protein